MSTPRHIGLYDAFGWKSPTFAHVGLLTDQNKQKLSKRHGYIDIVSYRNKGYLPEGLLNYVVLLGWSPGKGTKGTSEVMNLQQMINKVSFSPTLSITKYMVSLSCKILTPILVPPSLHPR